MIKQRLKRNTYLVSNSGQSMSEMVLLIPLMAMLMVGSGVIVYLCWQGVKVQQAANLAARITGQERLSGGTSVDAISRDNGLLNDVIDPSREQAQARIRFLTEAEIDEAMNRRANENAEPGTVYAKIKRFAESLFLPGERGSGRLDVEPPTP